MRNHLIDQQKNKKKKNESNALYVHENIIEKYLSAFAHKFSISNMWTKKNYNQLFGDKSNGLIMFVK